MTFLNPRDIPSEIALGNIPGRSIVQISGKNPACGTISEDVWDGGICATLDYDAQTGNFTPGLTITGGTSGATAIIVSDIDNGSTGTLDIRKVSGIFQNNEVITDTSTGSADTAGITIPLLAQDLPTIGETWEVICESANDTSAGTGATAILVTYLDDNHVKQTEPKTLNGQTAVTFTATDAFRMISINVTSWGSATNEVYGKTNLGTIVVRDSVSKKIRGLVVFDDEIEGDEHGVNNTQMSHYTVPAGVTSLPMALTASTDKNHDIRASVLVRLNGVEGFSTLGEQGVYQSAFIQDFSKAPAAIPEKTDTKIIARSNNSSVPVVTRISFIEVLN